MLALDVQVEKGDIQEVESAAVVVNLFKGVTSPRGATGAVDKASGGLIKRLIKTGDFKGKLKETAVVYPEDAPFERVIVVGLGEKDDFTLDRARRASAAAAKKAQALGVERFHTIVHGAGVGGLDAESAAQAVAEGAVLALYDFDVYKTGKARDAEASEEAGAEVEEMVIVERAKGKLDAVKRGAEAGLVIAESVNLTRDLATLSGDEALPERLAERAEELAGETGLKVEVLDLSAVQGLGMGGLVGVNRGSRHEPRFVIMEHNVGRDDLPTVVVAGKGVTFDTGGISIKPSKNMGNMRFDKSGACAVVGVMRAVALLDVPLHVVGLTPFTDNMPGGNAYKPGDVLTALNGKTIEVLNTDAEGRLILADALAYADRFDPEAVVDMATLTGSVVVGLGEQASGVMGNNGELIARLKAAGEATHERVWELPFYEEYDQQLDSKVADVKNVGGRSAGAITAGKFLSHFVGEWPWAHLDIAGTAYNARGSTKFNPDYSPDLATGVGVRLITQLLRDWEPLEGARDRGEEQDEEQDGDGEQE